MTTQNQSKKATPAQVSPPALPATTEAAQIKWRPVPDAYSMTDEQAEAIAKVANCCGGIAYDIYRAALAASPTPPPPAEQQAMESVLVDGAASQPPISNTLWRMLTGGYEHTYILQLPNDSRDRRELIDRACHNWRRICAEIGNSAVASAVSPQTAQAPQQAAPKAAPDHPPMPENWGVVVSVNSENILCIGQDYLHGKRELSEAEELAIVGMAQHLLAFVGYGLPPSIFDPDDDAAPKQEAQEPMAIKAMGYGGSTGINDYLMSDGTIKAMRPSEVVWAAPQPAPAPLSDDVVQDAARWRWLSEHIGAAWDEGKFTSLVRIVSDKNRAALNASIDRMMADDWSDAALAAQGGQ